MLGRDRTLRSADSGKDEMLSGMQYPHWLMVAGAALVMLGFIDYAFRKNRNVDLDNEPTEMKVNGE